MLAKANRQHHSKSNTVRWLIPHCWYENDWNKLNEIADKARTGGQYEEIGTIYGFTLLVKTEISEKEGVDL